MKPIARIFARVRPPRGILFTLIMAGLLLAVAIISGSATKSLTVTWQDRLGFAPSDLFSGYWERMFTSALVTSGGLGFWLPYGAMIGLISIAEWLTGTRRTALAFWLSHLGACVGEAVFTGLAIQFFNSTMLNNVHSLRDVGPSAGYFGCIGVITAHIPRPWRYLVGVAIIAALVGGMIVSAQRGATVEVTAGLAHLLAFPIGWSVTAGTFLKRPRA